MDVISCMGLTTEMEFCIFSCMHINQNTIKAIHIKIVIIPPLDCSIIPAVGQRMIRN